MDKKNTMLLTVIAVATLLVAVVGATFAFFSLTATDSSTTTGTITTDAVGTATLGTTQSNLTLTLKPEDMVDGLGKDVSYYAVAGSVDSGEHGSESPIPISYASYKGGTAGTSYKCPVQVSVTATGTMTETPGDLQEGWTSLILEGEAVNKSNAEGMTGVTKSEDGKYTVDLKKALTAGVEETFAGKSVVLKGEVTLAGPSIENKNILSASLSLINKQNVDQNKIAGKTLNVGINVTPDGECTVVTD